MATRKQPNNKSGQPLQFPDPGDSSVVDGQWQAPNGLLYEWIDQGPTGTPLSVGYWNVVGTVGSQGPMGPPGMPGANGLYPTISANSGCWIYNYNEQDALGNITDKSEPTNHPSACAVRVIGSAKPQSFIDDLNSDSKWTDRQQMHRNDAFMIETFDNSNNTRSTVLWMIPWHEDVDGSGVPNDKDTHKFVDMGYMGMVGQTGDEGEKGEKGEKGVSKLTVVQSMPMVYEEGDLFLDKTTNTMFVGVVPATDF